MYPKTQNTIIPMAFAVLLLVFSPLFLPFSAVAQTNGTVTVGESLTATGNVSPWLSPSGDFAFGFQPIQDKDLYLLSVWYNKLPNKTVVWYPAEATAAPRGSKVVLTAGRGLVLSDPQGNGLWTSDTSPSRFAYGFVAYGFLNDTGNFLLVSSDSVNLWESFKYPTDTMLPGQIMEADGSLFSRASETNLSRGRFQLRLVDGNLVLNTRDIATGFAYDAYYIGGVFDPSNASNNGYQINFNQTGYLYVLRRNNSRFSVTPEISNPVSENYHRATLTYDGVFAQYYHPKSFTGNPGWNTIWSLPENICSAINGEFDSGACGFNNICSLDESRRPVCECPSGYSLSDPSDKHGNCKPDFIQSCYDDGVSSGRDLFDFKELSGVNFPFGDYGRLQPISEQECKDSCLNDCFCPLAIFSSSGICWKKRYPLANGRINEEGTKAFLKVSKGKSAPQGPYPLAPKAKKDQKTLIVVGSVLLSSSLFVNFLLIGVGCLGFFLIYRKKKTIVDVGVSNGVETNLICFTYEELAEATNGFKEELGRGAFGIVYKGVLRTRSRDIVAVKKLDRVVKDGEKEFKTEVNIIARTHHKNLVRLIGFCDGGQHRLLVYEYMGNGTLSSFLFGNIRPSWKQRSHIALGIARGLSYLHEECSTQIIHCDIKLQNILLDEYYNARISDFGLAKLLMINQSRTDTGIRGTRGYVAQEWFRSNPITIKVDVYSFGILLLEIISCRRSVEEMETGKEERKILTDWVWECYQERGLDVFVENDSETLDELQTVRSFVMVGLWCIQEDPSKRPVIKKVIRMLEGVIEVTQPPCPFPSFDTALC